MKSGGIINTRIAFFAVLRLGLHATTTTLASIVSSIRIVLFSVPGTLVF